MIPRYQKLEGVARLSDYVRRYDGDVRFTDSQVGSLLAMLFATGAEGNTVVAPRLGATSRIAMRTSRSSI